MALAAQREVSRLQGLYDRAAHPASPVHITITRRPAADPTPEGPEDADP